MRLYSLLKKNNSKHKAGLLYILVSSLFILLFLIPLIGSFWYVPLVSLKSFAYFQSYYLYPLFITLLLGASVSFFALLLATVVLFCFERTQGIVRKILLFITPIPLVFPPYIAAITYIDIFKSPVFLRLFGRSEIIEFTQATFVLSLFLYPYIFLLLVSRMRLIDPQHYSILALYEFTFFDKLRIFYIPHLKYTAFSGMMLVFLYTISDFGAVSILRMNTLTVQIYYEFVTRFNKPEASLIATSFIFISIIVVYISQRLGRKGTLYKSNTAQPFKSIHKKNNIAVVGFLVFLICFSVGIPLIKILSWLYIYMVDTSAFKDVWIVAKQSLFLVSIYSFGIAGFVTLLSISIPLFFYAVFRRGTLFHNTPYLLAFILHALPGIVVAFGVAVVKVSFVSTFFLSWLFFLSAYIYRYSGIGFVVIEPAVRAIPNNYTRIGSVFLKGKVSFVTTIMFPLIKTSLVNGGNYIFFNSIRDLAIPLILTPLGVEVLSVRIWQTANEGLYPYAAPAIIVLLLLSLPSVILFVRNSL